MNRFLLSTDYRQGRDLEDILRSGFIKDLCLQASSNWTGWISYSNSWGWSIWTRSWAKSEIWPTSVHFLNGFTFFLFMVQVLLWQSSHQNLSYRWVLLIPVVGGGELLLHRRVTITIELTFVLRGRFFFALLDFKNFNSLVRFFLFLFMKFFLIFLVKFHESSFKRFSFLKHRRAQMLIWKIIQCILLRKRTVIQLCRHILRILSHEDTFLFAYFNFL